MMKRFAWIVADVNQMVLLSLNRGSIRLQMLSHFFLSKKLNLSVLWGSDEGVRLTTYVVD